MALSQCVRPPVDDAMQQQRNVGFGGTPPMSGGRPNQPTNQYHQRMPQWPGNTGPPPVNNTAPRPTGAPSAAPPAAAPQSGPIPLTTKIPLSTFPPAIANALKQSWDKDGSGFVTVAELCAGAADDNSAKAARQARELSRMGQNKPSVSQFKQPGQWNEMPGDLAVLDSIGLGEGQNIWERMAAIIRARRLDVRILLDAHDRRNCGLVDLDTFRRALCYAFGNNWIELAMTSAEFDEVVKPYLTRNPNKPGDPAGFVFWQKFSVDLQTLADRHTHTDKFMARLTQIEAHERVCAKLEKEYGVTEYELKTVFAALKHRLSTHGGSGGAGLTGAFRRMDTNHGGTVRAEEIKKFLIQTQRGMEDVPMRVLDCIIDLCDADGDGEINYAELSKMILCDDIIELLSLVPDKTIVKEDKKAIKVGSRGCTVGELQAAQQAIKAALMLKHKGVQQALRAMDTKGDGTLSRQEIIAMLHQYRLIKHTDYYTGVVFGEFSMAVADTLIDYVDTDKDGKINYQEFTKVLVADDIMQVPAPKHLNPNALWGGRQLR